MKQYIGKNGLKTVFGKIKDGFYTKDETAEVIAKAIEAAQGDDARLDALFGSMLDGKNTTGIFQSWWPLSDSTEQDRYKRLERFGTMLANAWDGKVYTVRGYNYLKSSDPAMEALDDLAPLGEAALATDTDDGGYDWAEEDPMTWYVRGNAISKQDGTMNITAIEGVDEGFDITGESAPVYTFALALWWKETRDENYVTKSWRTTRATGFRPHAGDVAPDGKKRVMTWHSTFGGGFKNDGTTLTSGAGRKCANFNSAINGLTTAREVSNYEGLWCDCDTDWLLGMWQLRHQNKENSDILDGCYKYNEQVNVAKSETSAKRVLVSKEDGKKFIVGSTVSVGTATDNNHDRRQQQMRDIADLVVITSIIEDADGSGNTALNLDMEEVKEIPETAYVSTMPWHRGNSEKVPGHKDGCVGNLTDGKHPARIAGVEVFDGAFVPCLDPLYNVTTGTDSSYLNYAVHECKDSEKLSTDNTITKDYSDTEIRFTGMTKGWDYIKEFVKNDKGIVFPEAIGGSGTTYYKSAFSGSTDAGVRCPWRLADLDRGILAGLASGDGYNAPGNANWNAVPRLSGSGKKRGTWSE